ASSTRAGKLISCDTQIGPQPLRRLEILPSRLDGDGAVTQVAKIADDVLDQRLAFVTFGKCRFHLDERGAFDRVLRALEHVEFVALGIYLQIDDLARPGDLLDHVIEATQACFLACDVAYSRFDADAALRNRRKRDAARV